MRYQPRTKPFPHQSRATLAAVRARNFGLFLEPRLGKSKAALDYVGVLALKGEVKRVLILFPAIARDVWQQQIYQHYPGPCNVEDFDRSWFHEDERDQYCAMDFFLASREETFRATRTPKGGLLRPKQKLLEQWVPDVIIFDESHEYKRPGGRSSQDAWRLVRRLRARSPDNKPYVLLLSGTPNPKGWRDLFAQFRIMDDTILGTNAGDFDEEYVVYGQGSRKYTIVKYKSEKKLEDIVRQHSLSLSAEAVGMAGVVTWQALKVNLPPKTRNLYTRLATDLVVYVHNEEGGIDDEIEAVNAGVLRLRLRQITGGFTTGGKTIHTAKVEALVAYLKLLHEQRQHVLVYCNFSPEVRACLEACQRVGYRTHVVEGATSKADRAAAIEVPGEEQEAKAVVFQIQAGSRAIDLSWAAELVFYSVPDGWVDYWQALNRVRGPNQSRPVRITHLLARSSVDVADMQRLRRKEDAHATMMQNPRRYLGLI